jgi:hypothetical protein
VAAYRDWQAQDLRKATHGNAASYHSDCHCEISE